MIRLLAALVLAGPAPAAAPALPSVPSNPDTYIELSRSDDLGIDPARVADGYSRHLVGTVYETLVALAPGKKGEYEARLASVVPTRENGLVSADGKVWRFPIREGVRFHDGRRLTAEDARYTLIRRFVVTASDVLSDELLRVVLGMDPEPEHPADPAEVLRRAREAVTVEGRDLVVRLAKPSNSFLAILAADGYILSKGWCKSVGDWDGTEAGLKSVVGPSASRALMNDGDGTGPFRLERWDRAARQIVFVRHDGYWRRPAALKRAIVKAVPETLTRVLMLKNGDADSIAASVAEEPLVKGVPGVRVYDELVPPNRSSMVYFNFGIDPARNPDIGSGKLDGEGIPPDFFTDKDVRLGFAHALDSGRYIRDVLRGRGRVASGFLPPGLPGYSDGGLEYKFDRTLAEKHFRRAWGGRLWEKGFKFTVLVNTGSAWRPALVEILRRELSAINPKFEVTTRVVDWSTLLDRAGKHQTTLYIQGLWEPAADPLLYARALLHARGRMAQRLRYSDPQADRLVEAAETESDPARLPERLRDLQRFAHDECPFVPVAEARGEVLRVEREWVKGYVFTPFFPGAPETTDFYSIRKE
ncbi:MAG: ABC transporter substrate-binding protein [Elusimicrobia bacterium]|nr:ABC transporter substrate-binding protein [Elusimicrobiota bacterium]